MSADTTGQHGMRSIGFRLRGGLFDIVSSAARARNMDISAMLNWIIAEASPTLIKLAADHDRAVAAAAAEWERERAASPMASLAKLRELLGRLQDEYAAMSNQTVSR